MKILTQDFELPHGVALILGFFDGIHAGHCDVLKNTKNTERVVVTFSASPTEFFQKETNYIYSREKNYALLEESGIDYIYEQDFKTIANLSAKEYLNNLVKKFKPISITSGFNHTFGANRLGDANFLEECSGVYEYFCTAPTMINNEIVSSTKIKEFLSQGEILKANCFLGRNFSIKSEVIEGQKLGRELGFPTANMKYPKQIVKIPYGVYKVKVLNRPAIMNWGIKPTIGSDEVIEVHIPNFEANLYGQRLEIEIISKLREERKFKNLNELKEQIEKDVAECLKL